MHSKIKISDKDFARSKGIYRNKTYGSIVMFVGDREGIILQVGETHKGVEVGQKFTTLPSYTIEAFWDKVDGVDFSNIIEVVETPKLNLYAGLYHEELIPSMTTRKVRQSDDTTAKASAIYEVLHGSAYEGTVSLDLKKVRDMTVWCPFENSDAGIVVKGGHFPTGLVSSCLAPF